MKFASRSSIFDLLPGPAARGATGRLLPSPFEEGHYLHSGVNRRLASKPRVDNNEHLIARGPVQSKVSNGQNDQRELRRAIRAAEMAVWNSIPPHSRTEKAVSGRVIRGFRVQHWGLLSCFL